MATGIPHTHSGKDVAGKPSNSMQEMVVHINNLMEKNSLARDQRDLYAGP